MLFAFSQFLLKLSNLKNNNYYLIMYGEQSYLIENLLSDEMCLDIFTKAKDGINWSKMYNRGSEVPRLVAIQYEKNTYGDIPVYRHPVDEQPDGEEFNELTLMIKNEIEKKLGQKFNHCLIQYYKNGSANIGEHSDKTLDIEFGTNIVNYSIGATRTFILKDKDKIKEKQRIKLPHNSLFVMDWDTNRKWLHAIHPDNRPECEKTDDELDYHGSRISYTFRTISTFITKDNKLYGKGAKVKTKEELNKTDNTSDDSLDMLKAFSKENHESNFDYNLYKNGFDSLNLKTINI